MFSRMVTDITLPTIPFVGQIPSGVRAGSQIIVEGHVPSSSSRFDVNLVRGHHATFDATKDADIALHVNPRFDENLIVLNSRRGGEWADRNPTPSGMPIQRGYDFTIAITVEEYRYTIEVNGEHYAHFPHRMEFDDVAVLFIDGVVDVRSVQMIANGDGPVAVGYASSDMYVPS